MAGTFLDQYAEAQRPDLLYRVQAAICLGAQIVAAEGTAKPNHANRVALANRIANSPAGYAQSFAFMCAAQGIDHTSTDLDIRNMIAQLWDTVAGGT